MLVVDADEACVPLIWEDGGGERRRLAVAYGLEVALTLALSRRGEGMLGAVICELPYRSKSLFKR